MLSHSDPGVGGSCPTAIPRELEAPFLASLVYESPLGIVLTNTSGHLVFANQAAARLNGAPIEAQVGRHIREIAPDLWDEVEPVLQRTVEGAVVECVITGETPCAPGVTHHWAEQWFPVRGPHGDVAAVGAPSSKSRIESVRKLPLSRRRRCEIGCST